jgi:hypothetical protein
VQLLSSTGIIFVARHCRENFDLSEGHVHVHNYIISITLSLQSKLLNCIYGFIYLYSHPTLRLD